MFWFSWWSSHSDISVSLFKYYFKNECKRFIRFLNARNIWNQKAAGRVVLLFLSIWKPHQTWSTSFWNYFSNKENNFKLSLEQVFSIQTLYLRHEICMILKTNVHDVHDPITLLLLSDNFWIFSNSMWWPCWLSVLSKHVASQSKWQSADLDLLKQAKR